KPERRKPSRVVAVRRRLQSTRGGSRETAAKELAVRPRSSPSGVRVVTTTTPVAKRPSARRKESPSGASPSSEGVSSTLGLVRSPSLIFCRHALIRASAHANFPSIYAGPRIPQTRALKAQDASASSERLPGLQPLVRAPLAVAAASAPCAAAST